VHPANYPVWIRVLGGLQDGRAQIEALDQ